MTAKASDLTRFIAEQVRIRRQRLGFSQAELALLIQKQVPDCTRTMIVKIETGRRESVRVEELLALAAVFNVQPTDLLPKASPMPISEACRLRNVADYLLTLADDLEERGAHRP